MKRTNGNDEHGARERAWRRWTGAGLLLLSLACPPARTTAPPPEQPRTEQWSVFRGEAALAPAASTAAVQEVDRPVDVPLPITAPTEARDRVEGGLQTTLLGPLTLAAGGRAALRVVVERQENLLAAEPLPGADVWVALGGGASSRTLFHGATDAAGAVDANFRVPRVDPGETLLVVHVRDPRGTASGTYARTATVADPVRVLLTTDKPMYQPGQEIHLRALAISSRGTGARSGLPISFVVADAKGNKLYRGVKRTSDQGVASLDFPIASQVNTGPWLVSLLDAAGGTLAEKTVTVERYVLPKFQVTVTFDRPWYKPGDVVSGTVNARYFFGQPVAGGRVTIAAQTFDVGFDTFAEITGTTDDDGVYGFEVTLPEVLAGSDVEGGNARVMFETTVKDTAEHEETDHGSVVVSQAPVSLLVMPESGRLVPGVDNVLWIAAARPDGSPVTGTVSVDLRDGVVTAPTDELGIATLRYRPRAEDGTTSPADGTTIVVPLAVSLTTADGELLERLVEVRSTAAAEDQVLLRLEKAIVRAGTATHLQVRSTRTTGTVYLDVVQQKQTVLTKTLDLGGGVADFDFAVPPEMSGTLELHAWLLRRDGEFVRDGRVMVVEPADELRIDVQQSKPEYLPGEPATIRFAVTDEAGNPKAAALGLIMVDEAVYALQEMQPGLEKVYFLLEKEILQPRYELHFSPGGVSVDEAVKVRDLPEIKQRAALILLAAAEPEPSYDLDEIKAREREAFRTQKLPRIYGALERLMGLRGAETVRDDDDPSWFRADVIGQAVEHGFLTEDEAKGPSGEPVTPGELAALEGGLEPDDLAVRAAVWGVMHVYQLLTMYAQLRDGWCPGSQGYDGDGLFCLPDDVIYRLPYTHVPEEPARVALAEHEALYDPWGRRYVVRTDRDAGEANVPEWSLAKVEVFSRGPDGERDTDDDIYWYGLPGSLAPDGTRGEYDRFAVSAPLSYYEARTAEEAEWAERIAQLFWERESRREERRWRRDWVRFGARPARAVEFDMLAEDAGGGWGGGGGWGAPMAAGTVALSTTEAPGHGAAEQAAPGAPPARIREFFPETLLWRPEVVTDDEGKAQIDVDMADSITSWRLSVVASAADGSLGSRDHAVVVFQPFFVDIDLPVALTQNDEVSIPVALYNYLDEPQDVALELVEAPWFEARSERKVDVRLEPREVTSRFFRIRAKGPGTHALTVYAVGSRRSDAIRRDIRVEPDGVPVETTFSENLVGEVSRTFELPAGAIPGSEYLEIKVYPGAFAQAVENLDSMLQMPGGCFEQTSSSTYPNLLVLDYLKRTETITPEIQMKAEQYVQLGYQRLLTFECTGGGFEWFGNSPAHLVLTAYGLREFTDMAAVYPVDPAVIERTKKFLLDKQRSDGSWDVESGGIAEGAINRQQGSAVNTTAYVAWALIDGGVEGEAIDRARRWLAGRIDDADDPYTLGLLLQVFAGEAEHAHLESVLTKLMSVKHQDEAGGVFWSGADPSAFGSTGDVATIEATALVALGLIEVGREQATAQGALDWLVRHKDALGNWSSTQATILTLRALIEASMSGPRDVTASVDVIVNGTSVKTIDITPDTSDVMHLIDATTSLRPGANTVTVASSIAERKGLMAQITARSYVPWPDERPAAPEEPLVLEVRYDRSELATGDTIRADVSLFYRLDRPAENVIVDLGVPPGFDVAAEDLDRAVEAGKIARFELTGRQVIVYVQKLVPGERLSFDVGFTARYPLRAQAPSSEAYLYYDPAVRAATRPVELSVGE